MPLGGLGEVGLNALALESGGERILVDCGLFLPQANNPGIDYLIPDFSCLREQPGTLRAVFLTHGHDDHVGAVGHLLREFPVPVYGTPMALGLLEQRYPEVARAGRDRLVRIGAGSRVEAGPFAVEFLRVTHSIPDACALGIGTPGGAVLHTGDFTFDPCPVDGRLTDEEGLARWGARGVDLLCCDSTNAARPGSTPSQRGVGEALHRLLPKVAGRAYVATFSSHVHRVQQVLEASRQCGRRVALLGRSVVQSVRLARRLGHLKTAPGDLIPEPRSRGCPRETLTVVLGGSQAEPGSALWRVAHGRDSHHRIEPGDHLFLSARTIPGHEVAIHGLVNRCLRQGATVHWGEPAGVHASGHPAAADVSRMLELTRPAHLLPVHGELRHLEALAGVAREWGLPGDRIFRVENGQTLLMEGGRVGLGSRVKVGRVLVEGDEMTESGDRLVAERLQLGRGGVALAVVGVQPGTGDVAWGPRVRLRGVLPAARAEVVAREAEADLGRRLDRGSCGAPAEVEEELARGLKRLARRLGDRRPLVLAVALEEGAAVDGGEPGPVK